MTVGPWVFVDDVDAPVLRSEARHHLERALRVRTGDALVVSDGRGRSREVVLLGAGEVELAGEVRVEPRPSPAITIAFAITKGDKPELAVQTLTELGVDRIVPFAAARSVARWDGDRARKHVERLRRIAREASMQCRRAWLPEVSEAISFAAATELSGAVLADGAATAAPTLAHPTVLVGPEGGWAEEELDCGLPAVALGPHVLRAETAAMAAATLLAGQRARLVGPVRAE